MNTGKRVIEVWEIFHSIQLDRDVLIRKLKETVDLSLPLVRLLLQIDEMKGASQTEIAETLGLDVGNLSRMCRILEDRNLIQRDRSAKDRRALEVRLSDEGQKLANGITNSAKRALEPHLKQMTDKQIQTMCDGMEMFIEFSKKLERTIENDPR